MDIRAEMVDGEEVEMAHGEEAQMTHGEEMAEVAEVADGAVHLHKTLAMQ